jgi:hypothetical protein
MAKVTNKEKQDFDKLYQYVKKILGYSDDMALPKFMVMRLKGLKDGKFIANNKTKSKASYDYYTIYLTFIYCKDKIQKALQTKKFANEQNKFNYIMAIVENNINDVVIRLKNVKKVEEKIEKTKMVDYEIKVDKTNSAKKSDKTDNQIFNSLTDNLW